MYKKDKNINIISKSVWFMIFVSLIIVIIIFVSNFTINKKQKEFKEQVNITYDKLGHETFKNIKNGNAKLVCDDAKKLAKLFMQINSEFSDDNITGDNIQQIAVSSPSKQVVDNFSKNLVNIIRETHSEDYSKAQLLLQQITQDIYMNIVQTSIMVTTGNISEKEFYEYIDITYCGAIPPATYISPKDILIYSINNSLGRGLLEELNDNITNNILNK